MKGQTIQVLNSKWDRCARKSVIKIGKKKEVLGITFAPAIESENEMKLFVRMSGIQFLDHVRACVIKLFNVSSTLKKVVDESNNASFEDNNATFTLKNSYLSTFLDVVTMVIDPAPDSLKYEAHMHDLATSRAVPSELRAFANRMYAIYLKKQKNIHDPNGEPYETQIKNAYREYWDLLMQEANSSRILSLVRETIKAESDNNSDFALAPVPVIDSERMLEYTEKINNYALYVWPKNEPKDNVATYIILSPEVFSDLNLLDKVIDYIQRVQTKFIVCKFKNLELDGRNKKDERTNLKHLLEEIIKIKHKYKDDRVFVLLEANVQAYLAGLAGFDIVSTSMTGLDGDRPFKRGKKNAINGYFDKKDLTFRNEKHILEVLANGGFRHRDCICDMVTDYEVAHRDWFSIRREHYIKCMNELFAEIWDMIDSLRVENCKKLLANSSISNLKQAVPLLDFV